LENPRPPSDLVRLPTSPAPIPIAIGELAPSFKELRGVDGKRVALGQFADAKAIVLMFTGNACPAAKACLGRVVSLQVEFAQRGVQVIAINSNNPFLSPEDSFDAMVKMATKNQLNFPYLEDPGAAVARRFGARNTPHFLLLDGVRRLRYRGRMFDSREPDRATTRDLQDALESVLLAESVALPETNPLGCSIVW
jgi:peroxiredoxin